MQRKWRNWWEDVVITPGRAAAPGTWLPHPLWGGRSVSWVSRLPAAAPLVFSPNLLSENLASLSCPTKWSEQYVACSLQCGCLQLWSLHSSTALHASHVTWRHNPSQPYRSSRKSCPMKTQSFTAPPLITQVISHEDTILHSSTAHHASHVSWGHNPSQLHHSSRKSCPMRWKWITSEPTLYKLTPWPLLTDLHINTFTDWLLTDGNSRQPLLHVTYALNQCFLIFSYILPDITHFKDCPIQTTSNLQYFIWDEYHNRITLGHSELQHQLFIL